MSEGTDSKDVGALLARIQRRLDSIEEKIDSLVRTSKPRSFTGGRSSEPRKEYDKSRGPKDRKRNRGKEEVSSEGKFYHGHPFGKKKDSSKSSFKKIRKPAGRSSK